MKSISSFDWTKDSYKVMLFIIMLLGLAIRVYKLPNLDVGGAWDEGYSMIAVRNLIEDKTLLFIHHMPDRDGILIDKPPGLYLLGAVFIKLFGNSEMSARGVSVLFGVISIYAFYVLIHYLTKERRLATLSACIFAFFPLHVALSRPLMGHVPALFFSITSIYFLIRGVDEKKINLLVIAGMLVAINLLTLLWFGILPVIGTMIWIFVYVRQDKDMMKYYFYGVICVVGGFLLFMVWPLLLWLNEGRYRGFHGGCLLPNCDVWDMLFKHNVMRRAEIYGWGTGIIKRLLRPYLGQGNFSFYREFDLYYKVFLYFGFFVAMTRFNIKYVKKISLFWIFWLVSYLPIQLGKNLYTQYLILLVPFFSFYIAYGIFGLETIKLKLLENKVLLESITILVCCVFFLKTVAMIRFNHEYLYQTNYKLIGKYLESRIEASQVIGSRPPGLSYYLNGECKYWKNVKREDLREYIKKNKIKYVEVTKGSKMFEPLEMIGCKKINHIIGIPDNARHSLFECVDPLKN